MSQEPVSPTLDADASSLTMAEMTPSSSALVASAALSVALLGATAEASAQVQSKLPTPWTSLVDPSAPRPEYPRPQMVRREWLNLNGPWQFGIGSRPTYGDTITVPFPIESALSGVAKTLSPSDRAYYRRTFRIPESWKGKRVILHFGAVDWETRVRVNGQDVGSHRGGYDPFSFDISRFLREEGDQEVSVEVQDPSDTSWQPRGKQVLKPGGIFYTPTSGIWQTVWLEPVESASIESMRITPDVANGIVRIEPSLRGGASVVWAQAFDGTRSVARQEVKAGQPIVLRIPRAKLWSPDRPFLYTLKLGVRDREGRETDAVESYFGMRSIAVGPDAKGVPRLLLNGKPLFQIGLLDQGFWPDGLYTAPTDEAMRYDLEVTKRLGFNMIRKHVKLEPATWYAHCDRMGILVWQDMPSGDRSIGSSDPDVVRSVDSANNYEIELTRMIDALANSPSIVMWVVFNEGWGQFDTARIAGLTKRLDPSRLVNSASGWTDRGVGDVHDVHIYPGPGAPRQDPARAIVLGEFGGLGLPLRDHTWVPENNWGYRSYTDSKSLTDALVASIRQLRPLIGDAGLSAAVYTQTTDVETEVNGLLTYDRRILKPDEAALREALASLFRPLPKIVEIVPTSEKDGATWRYTLQEPSGDWTAKAYNDEAWSTGQGGFGRQGTPGAVIRTPWESDAIWLRRTFRLGNGQAFSDPHFRIHHDEDVEVYLDGKLLIQLTGFTSDYVYVPIPKERLHSLSAGEHVLAVRCRQTRGGQFIDVGIVDLADPAATRLQRLKD